MKYQNAAEMRAALAVVVDDPELVEATIKQYFAPKALPKAAPVAGFKRSEQQQDKTYRTEMIESSNALGTAIERYLSGMPVQTPSRLKWAKYSTNFTINPDAKQRQVEAVSVATQKARRAHLKSITAPSDTPCFRCGAAKGCTPRKCAPVTVDVCDGRVNRQWDKEARRG